MAGSGSKVLAMRSVEFARNHNVPIHVRSAFTWEPGTWVTDQEPSMEEPIISGVVTDVSESKVTIVAVPDQPGIAAALFEPLAAANVNIDMIVQNTSHDGTTDISFTMPKADMATAESIVSRVAAEIGARGVDHDADIAKISLVGAGMKSSPGIAAKMFRMLRRREGQHRDDLDFHHPHQCRHGGGGSRARRPRLAHGVRARFRPGVFIAATGTEVAHARCDATMCHGEPPARRPRRSTPPMKSCARPAGCSTTSPAGDLSLAEFVETGNHETLAYLTAFGLGDDPLASETLVEIGSGIGRMTSSFTRLFGRVVACDLDAAFLERCRETVAQFGRPERLQTSPVGDGRTISLPDDAADLAFSYITFQHCHHDDALALTSRGRSRRARRRHIVLNFRTWTAADVVLWPAGKIVRGLWRVPKLGPAISKRRSIARLGWQANRLSPDRGAGRRRRRGSRM